MDARSVRFLKKADAEIQKMYEGASKKIQEQSNSTERNQVISVKYFREQGKLFLVKIMFKKPLLNKICWVIAT